MLFLFTSRSCLYCRLTRLVLDLADAEFQELWVDQDPLVAKTLRETTGQDGIPVVTDGEETVIGFHPDRILALARKAAPQRSAPPV